MKKPGIILSVIITTIMFIYTMSFVSSQNTCTGVRVYDCVAFEKKTTTQQAVTEPIVKDVVKPTVVKTLSNPIQQAPSIKPVKTSAPKQTVVNNNVAQETNAISQQLAEAKLAAQQAADALAKQQADAIAQQKAAEARLAAQQAAQQAAAAAVNVTTRAS